MKLGRWSLRMDEQRRKKAWVKKVNICPFIRAKEAMCLPTCLAKPLIPQAP